MAALEEQLGEGVIVRSDDVDGNEVSGVVSSKRANGAGRRFRALFNDDGTVVSVKID